MNKNQEKINMTCVSGFWTVNNKHGNQYMDWFQNSLKVNCPYVFFFSQRNNRNHKKI